MRRSAVVALLLACWPLALCMGQDSGRPAAEAAGSADERAARWREDLAFLVSELPKRHKNAFFKCSKEAFEAAAARLDGELAGLSDVQINVRLMMLAAMLGDAHTNVGSAGRLHSFPILPYWFADGLVVVAAGAEQRELIGARVVKIGDMDAEEACGKAEAVFAFENRATMRDRSPRYAMMGEVAEAVGLTADAKRMTVTLKPRAPEGAERSVVLEWMKPGENYVGLETDNAKLPLYRQRRGTANWCEWLEKERVVYFQYARCGDEAGQTVAEISQKVMGMIEEKGAERLIVDLRNNGGGNSALLNAFIFDLKSTVIGQRPGGVIVLIGRRTFSSAELNAAALKNRVGAVLIGEPTGQKPNAYGEVKTFQLPRSGLNVQYSTKFFRTEEGERESLEPDVLVELRSEEFFAGRDPVMEKAVGWGANGK